MQAHQPAMASQTLPGGMTREQAQQTYSDWQRMKQQGVPEDDPEYQKAHNIIKAIQQHNTAQKQKQAYAQQLQQQQQQAALQNGHAPHNGSDRGQQSPATAQPPSGQFVLTDEQRSLLRQQMMAYKLLSRDTSLPAHVQREVFPSQRAKSIPTPSQVLDAAKQALTPSQNGSAAATTAAAPEVTAVNAEPPRQGYQDYKSPYDSIQKHIDYLRHADRRNRLLIPSIMPPGVNYDLVREERETIIYNRIMSRKAELEKLPTNLATWDTAKHDTPTPDGSKKLKALIEYKSLCLLAKQRALRQQVSREMVQADNLAMTANRFAYRRNKKQSLREARVTERLEKQQRDARESKERQRQNNQLQAILNHKLEVENAAREARSRIGRFGKLMLQQHQIIEKEEQKRVERTAKQRLQALKANDEETYLKLLGQAKDSRISHLLKQTDGFLNQLAASVKSQQRSSAQRYGQDVSDDDNDDDDALEDDEDGGKKVDYYEVAHRVKETVTEQSSNLVGGTLKEYQLKGLQWMISLYNNNLNGILADEMGLGKTIQTISLITYLIEKKRQPGPFLVIVPLSTLTNWNNEFEKWAPSVNRIVYKGPPNARKQASSQLRYGNFQVLLTTYEFIIKDRPILSKVKWLHMIVDEGHRMKNAGSKLSSTITHYYNTRYRLILTGTPLQNNLPELWALLNFVLPNIFKSVKSFDEWFNTPFANTGSGDNMALTEEEQLLVIRRLHKVLRPFLLRRLKRDVEKDLPDKTERVIKCRFSALQAKLYSQLFLHQRLMISDGKGGKVGLRGLSNMLMQMRKLCNHPFVFEEVENQVNPSQTTNDLLWRTAGKFELLDRVLPKFRASGHRVLMFFQMTQIMNIMEDFMRLRGIPYLRLDGGTKSDERADLLKEFNAPNSPYFCFLLSTRAGGLGLNLQTADTVIIYDSDWNPHQDLQAQDRAHRIGQKNEVRILRLITSNSVEEKILERANFKLDMDGKVIQAGKFDNKSTNEERDAMLRVMLESAEAAETAPIENEEMDDDELNMMMARSDQELILFGEMDKERLKNDKYGVGKEFPRLMSEAELPDIYLQEDVPAQEENIEEVLTGRGARERTKIKYDDGLTEEQWLEAVDNDNDTIEEAIARKQAKKERRRAKASGLDSPAAGGDDDAGSESDEDAGPKKRSRKSAGASKRKAEDAALDSEPTPVQQPRKRGRKVRPIETLSAGERETLQKVLDTVYDTTMDTKDEDGRDIIDAFLEPVPKTFTDYHLIIRKPICMEDIGKRINDKGYQGCDEFARDMRLMCANAMTYNEESSLIYQDAAKVNNVWLRLLTTESATNANDLGRAAFTGPSALTVADGTSTAAPSGVSTPQASGMKIRLNHGGASSSANGGMNGDA